MCVGRDGLRVTTPSLRCHYHSNSQSLQQGGFNSLGSFIGSRSLVHTGSHVASAPILCSRRLVEDEVAQKRLALSSIAPVEAEARRNVQGLVKICEPSRRGMDASMLSRVRGLDVLYNRATYLQSNSRKEVQSGLIGSRSLNAINTAIDIGLKENVAKEHRILAASPYFKDIEDCSAGFVDLLAQSPGLRCEFIEAGVVLYREGDLGVDCYVVVSGEVDLYTRPQTVQAGILGSKRESQKFDSFSESQKIQLWGNMKLCKEGADQNLTFEGYSTYNAASDLGKLEMTLGPTAVFGEETSSHHSQRCNTAKCSRDCEVLIIPGRSLQDISLIAQEKRQFFKHAFPKMERAFRLKFFPSGHVFLREGIRSLEPSVYFIHRGSVAFYKYSSASSNPTYVLATRPVELNSWKSFCRRPTTGVAGSTRDAIPTGCALSLDIERQEVVEVLGAGCVFCSLDFLHVAGNEPVTAVAREDCVMFFAGPQEMQHLNEAQQTALRQGALPSMSRRVELLKKLS